jgi:hypothetical protein
VLNISDMLGGPYYVEFWDTVQGKVIRAQAARCVGGTLLIPMPAFDNDVAVKITRDPTLERFPSKEAAKKALDGWTAWRKALDASRAGLAASRQKALASFASAKGYAPPTGSLSAWQPLSGRWSVKDETLGPGPGGEMQIVCSDFHSDGQGLTVQGEIFIGDAQGNAGMLLGVTSPASYFLLAFRPSVKGHSRWSHVQLYRRSDGVYDSTWKCNGTPTVPVGKWFPFRLKWQSNALEVFLGDEKVLRVDEVPEPAGLIGLRTRGNTPVRFRAFRLKKPPPAPPPPTPPAPAPKPPRAAEAAERPEG